MSAEKLSPVSGDVSCFWSCFLFLELPAVSAEDKLFCFRSGFSVSGGGAVHCFRSDFRKVMKTHLHVAMVMYAM